MAGTVKFGYGSSKNISFHGFVDTEIDLEDWNEMSWEEQASVEFEVLNELVELWVVGVDE